MKENLNLVQKLAWKKAKKFIINAGPMDLKELEEWIDKKTVQQL